MNEHIGRYGEVAHYFARQFFVAGIDLATRTACRNPVLQQADQALAAGAGRQEVGDAFLAQSLLHDREPLRRTSGSGAQVDYCAL